MSSLATTELASSGRHRTISSSSQPARCRSARDGLILKQTLRLRGNETRAACSNSAEPVDND